MTEQIPDSKNVIKHLRRVRSFVRREGRLTPRQERALHDNWVTMGIEYQEQLLDIAALTQGKPLVIEVGFGMGKSLVEMAKAAPEKFFIGIEVHRPGVGACLADAAEQGVTNLRVMCHDAVEVLRDMIPEGSVDCFQLFFPDPWHKARHHKRRIVQLEFVASVRRVLKNSGVFHVATDWENYAEHIIEVMNAAPGMQNVASSGDYVARPEHRPLTKFEARGHRLGHGVWDIMFAKVD